MLHADADFSIAVESSVEAHDVRGVTLVQHLQLSNDLIPNGWFDLQVDQLEHRRHWVLFMHSSQNDQERENVVCVSVFSSFHHKGAFFMLFTKYWKTRNSLNTVMMPVKINASLIY